MTSPATRRADPAGLPGAAPTTTAPAGAAPPPPNGLPPLAPGRTSTPDTPPRPDALTRAPPESTGWMGALIWIVPVSVSEFPLVSFAVIDWSKADTDPWVTAGGPDRPRAFPMATTGSFTATFELSATEIVLRPETFSIWTRATSCVTS